LDLDVLVGDPFDVGALEGEQRVQGRFRSAVQAESGQVARHIEVR